MRFPDFPHRRDHFSGRIPARLRRALAPALGLALGLGLSACAPSAGRSLSGEENADALRLAQESRLELQTQSARLKELEGQLRDLTEILSWNAEQIQGQNRVIDSLRGRGPAAPAPASIASGGTAPAAAPKRISSDEASLYRQALDQHFGRNYAAAIKAFGDLQARYPQGAYVDNAEYWIGEGRYAQGDFAGALASFRKVLDYPASEKADDAQLKIGYCHLRLGDAKNAEAAFRKLVSLYPSSEYVDRAQGELDKLTGQAKPQ